jgi:hypothetical protein
MEDPKNINAPFSIYGFPDSATKFDRRHPLWRERLPRLAKAINLAFTRSQTMSQIERFVYFYGRLVAEDFMEVFLNAVNGYGFAALKLLRSMYEHTITLRYIHDHPNEVEAFIEYDAVQQFKLMQPIWETFGKDVLPAETVAEIERRYAEVKDKFLVTDCKECGSKRVNHTWNKLDFVSMAKRVQDIGSLIVPGYFIPLRHAHSTFRAILDRLERRDGNLSFQWESQPKDADEALMMAHNCLLVALVVQHERFTVDGLEAELQTCYRDWAEIWAPDSPMPNDGQPVQPQP